MSSPETSRWTPGYWLGLAMAIIVAGGLGWAVGGTLAPSALVQAPLDSSPAILDANTELFDLDPQDFIRYDLATTLSNKEEAIRKEALLPLPAPCCSDNSAYTCCCPCNLSRSIWGLSKMLIAEHGAGAEEVRAEVKAWLKSVAPDGHSGDGCYTGSCNRAIGKNGCAGMSPSRFVA